MINESGVSFYPGGGHNHDGENSTLINTSVYSVYDFPVQIIGDPNRTADQIRNLDSFKQLIIDTVNQSIIAPSGIVFQQGIVNGSAHIISRSISTETIATDAITANEIAANTITANEIAANTITANEIAAGAITASELAANIVLVNNIISSNNYVTGVSGWAINSNGTAEFDSASIRGAITADEIYINALNYWNSNGTFSVGAANNYLFYNGTNLELTGAVNATSGNIGDWAISGGDISAGNTVLTSNGVAQFGSSLSIGNNDIGGAEDIVATAIIRGEQFELQPGSMKGVFYTGTASSAGTGNFGISFYWNGTNVYARLYNSTNGTYQDVCLSNCGTGTTSAPATTTASTTTTTLAPGGGGNGGGTTTTVNQTTVPGGCAEGTVIPSNLCSPACPQDFDCICSSGGNYCIG